MSHYHSVLVVDDDPIQVAVLTAYFSGLGVEVIRGAHNSAEALGVLESADGDFDLIVSDLQMPEMDGLEFMRHLSRIKFSGELALISGVKSDLMGHAGRLAKMHGLKLIGQLSKPIDKESLDKLFARQAEAKPVQTQAPSKVVTHTDFIQALEAGDIILHYQPKIDVKTGRIAGAEALARWHSQSLGRIGPDVFIAFAEQNGRIEELTFHLLEIALKDVQDFLEVDPASKLAINLAPEMIKNIALPDKLLERTQAAGVPAQTFCFEITENSIVNLDPCTLEVLSRLRIMDFEIAVDDFGTGSSNIQTMRDFPYSELKIDRVFVSSATKDAFSRETVHAAVALAHEQGMRVVAEGIEDRETWDFIHELGIEQAQGFWMAKPMSPEDYCTFLSENQNGLPLIKAA